MKATDVTRVLIEGRGAKECIVSEAERCKIALSYMKQDVKEDHLYRARNHVR